jgi:hypothetical protein
MATDQDVLEYLRRAQDDPDLDDRVQLDGGPRHETTLRAHLRHGARGAAPAPLACDYDQIQRLFAQDRLFYREPWLTLTV